MEMFNSLVVGHDVKLLHHAQQVIVTMKFSSCGGISISTATDDIGDKLPWRIVNVRPPYFRFPLNLRYTGRCPGVMSLGHILVGKYAQTGRDSFPPWPFEVTKLPWQLAWHYLDEFGR